MENGNSVTTTSEVPTTTVAERNLKAFIDVMTELIAATKANQPMHSLHEGLSIIQEEVHELTLEVYKNPRKHPDRNLLARKEAIQVAAMAIRLLVDVL